RKGAASLETNESAICRSLPGARRIAPSSFRKGQFEQCFFRRSGFRISILNTKNQRKFFNMLKSGARPTHKSQPANNEQMTLILPFQEYHITQEGTDAQSDDTEL